MRRSKVLLVALALALAGAGGGVAVATTTHSAPTPPARSPVSSPAGSATIQVTTAMVAGQSEQILVDARGLPLYTYDFDTTTVSHVHGVLAQLWPPLVSAAPTEQGTTGKLSVVADSNGQQVRFNGHFLYTFVNDRPGQVSGQGVQGFSIASPQLGASTSTPSPGRQPTGYGY